MAGLFNRLLPSKRWTPSRYRALLRARGPRSTQFRTRGAILAGAILIGIVATLFAEAADWAGEVFSDFAKTWHWLPLVTTPLTFMGLVWLTRRYAPFARGSGIPQVIAAQASPNDATGTLISIRTVAAKAVLTIGAVLGGASVGREGPTVQLAAAVMGMAAGLPDRAAPCHAPSDHAPNRTAASGALPVAKVDAIRHAARSITATRSSASDA